MKRVLVLIHFTAKREGAAFLQIGKTAIAAVQSNLTDSAAFLNSNICFGFVGFTPLEVSDLHKVLAKAIAPKIGDNISVLELDDNIISTHPGLMEWQATTVIRAAREKPSPWK